MGSSCVWRRCCRPTRATQRGWMPFDRTAKKRRDLDKYAFCHLKDFRRVATRYDKPAVTYATAISPVAWWLRVSA